MPNPLSPTNGQGLALPLVTDSTGADPLLQRGYGRDAVSGADNDAGHIGVASMPAGIIAVDQDAAAAVSAELPAVAGKTNYLTGFSISGGGASAASVVRAEITGIGVTWGIDIGVPAGVDLAIAPIFLLLPNPIPASAPNTAIALDVPSFGAGNSDVSIAIFGYVSA